MQIGPRIWEKPGMLIYGFACKARWVYNEAVDQDPNPYVLTGISTLECCETVMSHPEPLASKAISTKARAANESCPWKRSL